MVKESMVQNSILRYVHWCGKISRACCWVKKATGGTVYKPWCNLINHDAIEAWKSYRKDLDPKSYSDHCWGGGAGRKGAGPRGTSFCPNCLLDVFTEKMHVCSICTTSYTYEKMSNGRTGWQALPDANVEKGFLLPPSLRRPWVSRKSRQGHSWCLQKFTNRGGSSEAAWSLWIRNLWLTLTGPEFPHQRNGCGGTQHSGLSEEEGKWRVWDFWPG